MRNRIIFLTLFCVLATGNVLIAHSPEFTDEFFIESCKFASTGANPYFILKPGYELVLEGDDDEGEFVRVVITVLDKTKIVEGVETRVVRERETVNGELVEVSRNYFAICRPTNDVFYFGEDVNIFEDGQVVSHEGEWLAGRNGARPGIIMPGRVLVGARHFQEIAPGVALDRAEITNVDARLNTPFGEFENVLRVRETTPLERGVSIKFYARQVGLLKDGAAELVEVNTAADTSDP